MAAKYRRITRKVFIVINVIVAITFLLACLAPYLNPVKWLFIAMLGLGFAFIVITLIAFILFWLIFNPRYILISLIPMLIGWKSISFFFAFNATQKFNYEKDDDVLRVVNWNVARFVEWKRNNNKGSQTRLKMMDLIKEQKADVLCLQELYTSVDTTYYNNLDHIIEEIGYPYYYFAWREDGSNQWVGNAIFSKLPLIDSGKIVYPGSKYPETLLHADIVFRGDTIRVYTTHLQSVQFRREDFEKIDQIKSEQRDILDNSRGIFSKLRRAFTLRADQARMIRELMSNDPYPTILTGDFNDVPNSYSYFTIRGNDMQDAFLKKGFGIGRTYNEISPTLRIDYILASKDLEIKQFNRVVKDFSDHYLLVSDMKKIK